MSSCRQLMLLVTVVGVGLGTTSAFQTKSVFIDPRNPETNCMMAFLCRGHGNRNSNCTRAIFDKTHPHYHVDTAEAKMAYCSGCGMIPHSTQGKTSPPTWQEPGDPRTHFSIELELTKWSADRVDKEVIKCKQRRQQIKNLQDDASSSNKTFVSQKEGSGVHKLQTAITVVLITAPNLFVALVPGFLKISFGILDSGCYFLTVLVYWKLNISNETTDFFFGTFPFITFMAMHLVFMLIHHPRQVWDWLDKWKPLKRFKRPIDDFFTFHMVISGIAALFILSEGNVLVLIKSAKLLYDAYIALNDNITNMNSMNSMTSKAYKRMFNCLETLVGNMSCAFTLIVPSAWVMFVVMMMVLEFHLGSMVFLAVLTPVLLTLGASKTHLFGSLIVALPAANAEPDVVYILNILKSLVEFFSALEPHQVSIVTWVSIAMPAVIMIFCKGNKTLPALGACLYQYGILAVLLGSLKDKTASDLFDLMYERADGTVSCMLLLPLGDLFLIWWYTPCRPDRKWLSSIVTVVQMITVGYFMYPILDLSKDQMSSTTKVSWFSGVLVTNFLFKYWVHSTLQNTDLGSNDSPVDTHSPKEEEPPKKNILVVSACQMFALMLWTVFYMLDTSITSLWVTALGWTRTWFTSFLEWVFWTGVGIWALKEYSAWFLTMIVLVFLAGVLLFHADKHMPFPHQNLQEKYKEQGKQIAVLQAENTALQAENTTLGKVNLEQATEICKLRLRGFCLETKLELAPESGSPHQAQQDPPPPAIECPDQITECHDQMEFDRHFAVAAPNFSVQSMDGSSTPDRSQSPPRKRSESPNNL